MKKYKFKHQVYPYNSVIIEAESESKAMEIFTDIFGHVLMNYQIEKLNQ
jgi:hypothetical protein